MRYTISTNDAKRAIAIIFKYVKGGKDSSGKEIRTWKVKHISESNEDVLVHTTEQWESIGCISLEGNISNKDISANFYYWRSYTKEERSGDEERYYLGRFTELILVHFKDIATKIVVE